MSGSKDTENEDAPPTTDVETIGPFGGKPPPPAPVHSPNARRSSFVVGGPPGPHCLVTLFAGEVVENAEHRTLVTIRIVIERTDEAIHRCGTPNYPRMFVQGALPAVTLSCNVPGYWVGAVDNNRYSRTDYGITVPYGQHGIMARFEFYPRELGNLTFEANFKSGPANLGPFHGQLLY